MAAARILILGGGFGGAFAARRLSALLGERADITLLDRKNYFVFQPLVPEIAGGIVNVLDAVTPLRHMLPRVRVRTGLVRAIDLDARRVQVVQGEMGDLVDLEADHLVIALGQVVDLGRFPGMSEHAFTVKAAADAFALRNHIIDCLERASITDDPDERRGLLTFVVVGAGLSGVEVMGEIQELLRRGLRYYPGIAAGETRLVQVEFQDRILPELSAELADYALGLLRRRGVEFRLGRGVRSAAAGAFELDDGSLIDTRTIVATIGNAPLPLLRDLPLRLERGRVAVTPDLRVEGRADVWCLGDAAHVPLDDGRPAPPTAQAAVQQARLLADNVAAVLDGRPPAPFAFRSRGTLASLGGRRAVARVGRLRLSGFPAWLLWRLAYLAMLPAWITRLRVAIDQVLDLFLPRNIVQTAEPALAATRFQRHRAGDVVVRSGQLGDGVHLVLSGVYEAMAADGGGRVYGPGDHFGDDAIVEHRAHHRPIRARTDAVCFVLARGDYERIAAALVDGAVAPPADSDEARPRL